MIKCASLLLFIIFVSFPVSAQTGNFEELSFNLTVLKSRLLLLEPIPLRLTLENRTKAPVLVKTRLDFNLGAVAIEIRQPNGKVETPGQTSHIRAHSIAQPRELSSGEKTEYSEIFTYRLQDYFREPGEYYLRASLSNGDGKILRSDWIGLTVIQPDGVDVQAYEYILNKLNNPPRSLRSVPFIEWPQDELEQFASLFPQTSYVDYVRYMLGMYYYEKEKERAAQQFRALMDIPNFFYAKEVDFRLKKIQSSKKNE